MFNKLAGFRVADTSAYQKGQQLVEDHKEKYETSDHPVVHKVWPTSNQGLEVKQLLKVSVSEGMLVWEAWMLKACRCYWTASVPNRCV